MAWSYLLSHPGRRDEWILPLRLSELDLIEGIAVDMILYGYEISPFVRKVHVTLRLKNIPFIIQTLNPFLEKDEVLALNPIGKVPVLRSGDKLLHDSNRIIKYLNEMYPTPPLLPNDSVELAQAEDWVRTCDESLTRIFAGQFFFQRVVKPFYLDESPDESLVEKTLTEDGPEALAQLERKIPETDFLFSTFSIADVALGSILRAALLAGFEICATTHPRLVRYLKHLYAEEAFTETFHYEHKQGATCFAKETYVQYPLLAAY